MTRKAQSWLSVVLVVAGQAYAAEVSADEVGIQRISSIPQDAGEHLLFLLQQIVNAATVSAVYGLIALGYTLVFRIIGRINLAFGDFAMVGGVFTFVTLAVLASLGEFLTPLALAVTLLLVAATGAVYGAVSFRLVFNPLRRAATYAPIVATLGLGIALRELVRLTQGAQTRWLPPVYSDTLVLWHSAGYSLTIVPGQLLVIGLVLMVYGGVWWLLCRTRFGYRFRASSEDPGMAALCGVAVERVVAQTVALSTALAMLSGYILMIHYGGVDTASGFFIGFKALVAAVVGGIGSVPGAMLGGLLIGLLETFWAAYFSFEYRDIAVFAVLTLVLIFRPTGIMADALHREDGRCGSR